jgi:hypothetical protein
MAMIYIMEDSKPQGDPFVQFKVISSHNYSVAHFCLGAACADEAVSLARDLRHVDSWSLSFPGPMFA